VKDINWNDQFTVWECGTDGEAWDAHKLDPPTEIPWNEVWHATLRMCYKGVLVTCAHAWSKKPADPRARDECAFIPGAFSDRWEYSNFKNADLYCGDSYYCSYSGSASCCDGYSYRGERPFEAIEAREVRDLVNNVPFAFVLDMHSTAQTLTYVCRNRGKWYDKDNGCQPGLPPPWNIPTNPAYTNGLELTNQMVEAYKTAAEASWQASYPGQPLPKHLTLKATNPSYMGAGQLPAWVVNEPAEVADFEAVDTDTTDTVIPNPTADNFDNATLRAVPAFNWELGFRGELANNQEIPMLARLARCHHSWDPKTVNTGRPRSTLAVVNEFDGARGMLAYLADQVSRPNAVTKFSDGQPVEPTRKDVAVIGFRIRDSRGRGIQQTELREDFLRTDQTAVSYIPAGAWIVETSLVAASDTKTYVDAEMTLTVSENAIPMPIPILTYKTPQTIHVGSIVERRQLVHFQGGKDYIVQVKLATPLALDDNDALANDERYIKVRALNCDAGNLPNGLNPGQFCSVGLPFKSILFRCDAKTHECSETWFSESENVPCDAAKGEFYVDGVCDDADSCASGRVEDQTEASPDQTPVFFQNGNSLHTLTGTLFRKSPETGALMTDMDEMEILPEGTLDGVECRQWVKPTGAHDCYNKGDLAGYNGKCYKSVINGNVWSPTQYPRGWVFVTNLSGLPVPPNDPEDCEPWVQPTGAHDCYNIGDRAKYQGVCYESVIDGNVWSPAVYPAGWKMYHPTKLSGAYRMDISVFNWCHSGAVTPDPMTELEIRATQKRYLTNGQVQETDFTGGWVHPSRSNGISVFLKPSDMDAPIRVVVRNTSASENLRYTLSARFRLTDVETDVGAWSGSIHPASAVITATDRLELSEKRAVSIVPPPDAYSTDLGGDVTLFFDAGQMTDAMRDATHMALVNKDEQVVASWQPRDGGLAIGLTGLPASDGPYTALIQNDLVPLDGSVYLCIEPEGYGTLDCGSYETLVDGCGIDACYEGEICCTDSGGVQGTCIDIATDKLNCGRCGHACAWNETCLGGTCARVKGSTCGSIVCPAGASCCPSGSGSGQTATCRDLKSDDGNCGQCGKKCLAYEACVQGACKPRHSAPCDWTCPAGTACCWWNGFSYCLDVLGSDQHCGACDIACDANSHCNQGECVPWWETVDMCPGDPTNCGVGPTPDCRNLKSDANNCGMCNHVCPNDGWCENGHCVIQGEDDVDVQE
jgi:hypothetical protein